MSLPERLSSMGPKDEPGSGSRPPPHPQGEAPPGGGGGGTNLVQRCVIIQKDERGYGFTVSGDNPVYVASVKTDGAAMRSGVHQGDRIVKVNGTLVTSRNHLEVVKLIKSGSYVALTLLGRPHPSATTVSPPSTIGSNRDSIGGRVTAPQPVDPDKDRELWQQKVHMTRAMYETAKEDFEKIQRQYVVKPSEKLHGQLLEKERTSKALENQLKQLTGAPEDSVNTPSNLVSIPSNRYSDSEYGIALDQSSVHSWASSLPTTGTSDLGSMSDSPHTSPSVSPTPNDPHSRFNGQDTMEDSQQEIITNSDEDAHSEDDQANDPGPFADIRQLETKPAHMAILLNYLISNSDPSPVLFHILSDSYSRVTGSNKELRKWAYEIYSTFIAQNSPLSISVEDNVISYIDNILMTGAQRTDNENMLRTMFQSSRHSVQNEIADQLADFRNKKDLGMGNFYGFSKLHDNMDRQAEVRAAEEVLIPHLVEAAGPEDSSRSVSDRDQATCWALATFLRLLGASKSSHSATLDRVQTFMMKDKSRIKFPGSRSNRAKQMKGHQFTLQHFYVSTFCNFCGHLIWGVGYQGYQCQSCEVMLHKQCVEEISETCGGKQKKRSSKWIPGQPSRKPSNTSQQGAPPPAYSTIEQLTPVTGRPPTGVTTDSTDSSVPTQPYPKEEESDLASALSIIAGLSKAHSVKSIVSRYESTSPTSGTPNEKLKVPDQSAAVSQGERRSSSDLSRSGSLNNKGEKSDRPARRAKSDVDVDSDTFRAINQSESSSASSLSKSVESPSASTDCVMALDDSDLDVETGLPSLKSVLGEDVLRKLKPKEKKRQEVINELFYTERAHLRNLKILDYLFNRPMWNERGVMCDLSRALFPNMEEMIFLHESLVKDIKDRSQSANPIVNDVGDILLKRFDGDAGERFRKGCAEYCRNQAFALDALKKQQRKEPKLAQFLTDAHQNPLCRRLELKDLVPSQMQRLTKYPLLIDNLLKHTTSSSEEHKRLERAMERCKHILAYVNMAVKECENYHKLKDIQKKLDRKAVENTTDPALRDIKTLDLTQHKLIFDGPLTWKLRPHRTVDLHALLFDDMLVLLQRQDDKYVLKCQNTNVQSTAARDEHRFTHSPVLRLQNLLARSVATDKKSFFVVNMSESRAQMYEFIASTQNVRIRWCKFINDKAEELKKAGHISGWNETGRSRSMVHPPSSEQIEVERTRTTLKGRSASTAGQGSLPANTEEGQDQVDQLETLDTSEDLMPEEEEELIQPSEVNVANAVTAQSTPVRSPLATLSQGSDVGPMTSVSWPTPPKAPGLNVPMPLDQLKNMAQEMNIILNRLVTAMSTGSEERHRLRQELGEAQQKLNFLKAMQLEMTLSGAVPAGRSSPRPSESSPQQDESSQPTPDIPDNTQQQIKEQNEQQLQQEQQEGGGGDEDRTNGDVTEEKASPVSDSGTPDEKYVDASEEMPQERDTTPVSKAEEVVVSPAGGGEVVHPGIQEATVTQLEESVEDLASHESLPLQPVVAMETQTPIGPNEPSPSPGSGSRELQEQSSSSSSGVIEVVAEEEDDDDDNNAVSVADLPLPDVGTISAASDSENRLSSMLDVVELEDSDGESDTDNDTITSKTSSQPESSTGHPSFTLEEVAGEEGEGRKIPQSGSTTTMDSNQNESGVKMPQPSNTTTSTAVSLSDVDPDLGEEGSDPSSLARSSSVDPSDEDSTKPPVSPDTTDPIQI